jgi:3-oxoadipate enol-lactonase
MPRLDLNATTAHYREDGNQAGPAVVFCHALGTDLSLWDAVIARMPQTLRLVRYDLRGHGQSGAPTGPYAMGALIGDAEQLLDRLEIRDCVFVGLSIGGMIAQGLAVKRLDQIRALVLSNTAAKLGTKQIWQARIDQIRRDGLQTHSNDILSRWFTPTYRNTNDLQRWHDMLRDQSLGGYLGCAAAISGTDFYTPTSGLRLPTLGIAGTEDPATPPDLVRETVNLIPGSRMELVRRAAHLPCVEQPDRYAEILTAFLREIGHV